MRLLTLDIDPATLAVAGLVGIVSYQWIAYSKNKRTRELLAKLPGPKPHPILGNSSDIKGGNAGFLETMHLTWPKVFGELYAWYVGTQCNVTISSPELMETILKSQKILDKGVDYNWYHAWLEQGLLVSKGDKWRVRRRLLTPAFHFKILDDFVEVFNRQSRNLCQILGNKCAAGSSDGTLVDIYPLMTATTLDIIGETATGTQLNTLIHGESEYAKAVHRMLKIITERTTKPWLANDYIFPFTPTGREHDKLLVTLHGFINNVIRNRRAEIQSQENSGTRDSKGWKPLLDILLEVNDLSDQDIREEIGTFMFGGHDTTSASMTWILYLMAAHPEHQQLVWEEIQDVFGDDDRDVTVEDIANLKYFDYCIKEALRMYPAAPLIERMATEDIQLGDYTIPEGSNILMLIYGMHRNPRIFPDPDKFDPERFFPENCSGRHPFAYIPFSAGPRNCIGQRFALTELKVVITNILRRFKLEVSKDQPLPIPSYQVVLKPLNGISLVLTPRS